MSFVERARAVIVPVIGLPVVLLLILVAVPAVLLSSLFGWGKTIRRSKEEVTKYIDDFLTGGGGEWDWDDFTSVAIADPELDRVRQQCVEATEHWPATKPGQYCSSEGLAELRKIADSLRELSNRQHR
jgi:hypothetical protein